MSTPKVTMSMSDIVDYLRNEKSVPRQNPFFTPLSEANHDLRMDTVKRRFQYAARQQVEVPRWLFDAVFAGREPDYCGDNYAKYVNNVKSHIGSCVAWNGSMDDAENGTATVDLHFLLLKMAALVSDYLNTRDILVSGIEACKAHGAISDEALDTLHTGEAFIDVTTRSPDRRQPNPNPDAPKVDPAKIAANVHDDKQPAGAEFIPAKAREESQAQRCKREQDENSPF